MSDETYQLTKEDIKKAQSEASKAHGGEVPAGSDAAMMQSIIDKEEKSKADLIEERRAALPLPDQPPGESDWASADARTVNVRAGVRDEPVEDTSMSYGDDALRGPATGDSAVRTDGDAYKTNTKGSGVGREAAEGLSGLPNDAVTQGKKNNQGLADTTNQDAPA